MRKYLQREHIQKLIQDTYATEAEHLWVKYPDFSVFRHPSSKKWYAIIMNICKNKLGFDENQIVDVLNVKCSPVMIGSLLSEKGFLRAYHMNKSTWISILLDETVPDDTIGSLLELSYDSVAPKRKRARKSPEETT